ncbi:MULTISPECIES: hypothetical protein [Mumia]|uniref:hypothetical protein n=1 Tax=Mumia TaxID=1546255 RepID=UPI00141FB66A|nr:hypothetical protein [Mumia sp. ZJ1417]QMW67893.1 hypothetical protein H4N58_08580 [Mumia sp. ZJ1417]
MRVGNDELWEGAMTVIGETAEAFEVETPFSEGAVGTETPPATLGFMPWTEVTTPFAEAFGMEDEGDGEAGELIAEAFESIRDEQFDEALAELIAETAEAADTRLAGEQPMQLAEQRQQLADAHLAPVGSEAERCVQRFADHVQNLDLEGLAPDQLDELLDRFEVGALGVTPAGEEFIGGLIKKAKSVVKTVVKTAGKIAKAALPILGPILNKLKALVRPLLQRVLAIAINKLPAALHEPARALAKRFGLGQKETEELVESEAEEEFLGESFAPTPVAVGDPETLAESLDAALAESVLGGEALEQGESFGHDQERGAAPAASDELEMLAEARSAFIDRLQAAPEGEDLTPAIDQFIPAILPALRLGIRLVGRPKVVGFLSGFLAKLISQWVGPKMSGPLSSAIVDVGLRVIGLEQGRPGELEQEAAPATLAATVEDTVRRLSEQPAEFFEDEDLLQVALTEAFEQAVAANFPTPLVRPDLQIAPSLGGSFVVRHARRAYAYKKFSRVPEIELTVAVAASITTFEGVKLDAALRAAGISLPGRFRVHLFESGPGTTLTRLARLERIGGAAFPRGAHHQLHALTVQTAGLLLREPRLGVDVPARFLESRHRISVGQRFFHLEPVGQVEAPVAPTTTGEATRPSDERVRTDEARGDLRLSLYFSEADAQRLAASVSAGRGGTTLLRALLRAAFAATGGAAARRRRSSGRRGRGRGRGRGRVALRGAGPRPGRRVRASIAKALAEWARTRGHEFVRAAQDPASGVTVTVHARGVPPTASEADDDAAAPAPTAPAAEPTAPAASPAPPAPAAAPAAPSAVTVTVTPGRAKP